MPHHYHKKKSTTIKVSEKFYRLWAGVNSRDHAVKSWVLVCDDGAVEIVQREPHPAVLACLSAEFAKDVTAFMLRPGHNMMFFRTQCRHVLMSMEAHWVTPERLTDAALEDYSPFQRLPEGHAMTRRAHELLKQHSSPTPEDNGDEQGAFTAYRYMLGPCYTAPR